MPVRDSLPASYKDNYDALWNYLNITVVTNYVTDMAKAWPVYLICALSGLIFCLLFMVLLKYCAPIVAWVCILGTFSCLTGLGFYFMFTRDKNSSVADDSQDKYNIAWAILCWIGALIMFLFVC